MEPGSQKPADLRGRLGSRRAEVGFQPSLCASGGSGPAFSSSATRGEQRGDLRTAAAFSQQLALRNAALRSHLSSREPPARAGSSRPGPPTSYSGAAAYTKHTGAPL